MSFDEYGNAIGDDEEFDEMEEDFDDIETEDDEEEY